MRGMANRVRWGKWIGGALAALLVAGVVSFFTWIPRSLDGAMNKHLQSPPLPALTADAKALHQRLTIVDLHGDTLLWDRDLDSQSGRGHIDLQRLQRGNVALQIFSSVTKTPAGQNYDSNPSDARDNITPLAIAQLQPLRTWTSLAERSLWHADKLKGWVADSDGALRLIQTRADLDQLLADRDGGRPIVGALLSTEGAQNLEGEMANVDRLFDAGYRMFGLAHFIDNEVAGSVHGEAKYGLTPFGRQVIAHMEAKGIIVDLAHASHKTIDDVLKIATRPVVYSHGGVRGVCPNNRNLSDAEVKGIAKTGGVIGIGYWDAAVCDVTPQGIVRSISYVRDLVGVDHVALGSDWDGAVWTLIDAAQVGQITQALIQAGYSDADIAKVMGGNAVRVLRATLP
jgi:membrane dipeptidase